MNKVNRGYLRVFGYFLSGLPVSLVGFVVCAVAILCMSKEDTNLPRWAWPWGNDINGDGDIDWKTKHYPNGTHTKFWARYQWFAIRNRHSNFDQLFALKTSEIANVTWTGNDDVSNQPVPYKHWHGTEGTYRLVAITKNGKAYPCYYRVKRWIPVCKTRCWRIMIGWNITRGEWQKKEKCEPKFTMNPFMSFTPKTDEMDCC